MSEVTIGCCNCGVMFCLPTDLYNQRVRDHKTFYCPNGHSQSFTGKTAAEKEIGRLERRVAAFERENRDLYAAREDLIGAFKACPIDGCHWHSRKQIARDTFAMGRGIERVRRDVLEHLIRDHASQAHEPKLLEASV